MTDYTHLLDHGLPPSHLCETGKVPSPVVAVPGSPEHLAWCAENAIKRDRNAAQRRQHAIDYDIPANTWGTKAKT